MPLAASKPGLNLKRSLLHWLWAMPLYVILSFAFLPKWFVRLPASPTASKDILKDQ